MALRSSGSMASSPISAVGHKKRSHACGGSPFATSVPARARLHHEEDPQFPHSLLVFLLWYDGVTGCFAHTADHEEGRGDGIDDLWGAAQALSHGSGVDTGGAG